MINKKIFDAFDDRFIRMWVLSSKSQTYDLRRPPPPCVGRTWLDYVRSIGAETISHPAVQTFGFKKVSFGYAAPDGSSVVIPDPHALRNFDREDLYIHMGSELATKILTLGLP